MANIFSFDNYYLPMNFTAFVEPSVNVTFLIETPFAGLEISRPERSKYFSEAICLAV